MNKLRLLPVLALSCLNLYAHPMGNFSVNHYARIDVAPENVEIRYVLDLAEVPTLQLLQAWNLQAASPRSEIDAKATQEARQWVRNLVITQNGHPVTPRFEHADAVLADGVGGLSVLRITSHLRLPAVSGTLNYEDRNFDERAGWKEIVIASKGGAVISKASQGSQDRSEGLTAYPQDPTVAPPQDLRASLDWSTGIAAPLTVTETPKVTPIPQPVQPAVSSAIKPLPPTAVHQASKTGPTPPESGTLGSLRRGDFLSRTLSNRAQPLGFGLILICAAVAFGLGALHAFEPGHGKTMVAAYLVGSRGTVNHAIFLGGMVTFTHTVSVFLLGLATLFLSNYIVPEKISRVLGIVSGLSIVWIGGLLLYRRARKLRSSGHAHSHPHPHAHSHDHVPAAAGHTHTHHEHSHAHGHSHSHPHPHTHDHDHTHAHHHEPHDHSALTHTHDGHTHSHVPEGEITLGSLMALGASGGLVPCPSALVLLLSAISLGHTGLGLVLLLAFSLGLALVLMATGMFVLFARNLFPKHQGHSQSAFWKLMPVLSAAFILTIGLLMTGVSLGWIPASRFLG